jgi:predicted TIM-barrel fold metal-dependent hydrolase
VGGRPQDYVPYFEPALRGSVAELFEEHDRYWRLGKYINMFPADITKAADVDGLLESSVRAEGGWDFQLRIAELDREGIAAEVLHSGHHAAGTPFFHIMNRPFGPDLRAPGSRAYHRWAADFMSEADGRMVGVADPGPCLNMDETLRELEWVAAHGFVSVGVPGYAADPDLPPLSDPYFEPFWAACETLDLVLSVHIGHGQRQGRTYEFFKALEPLFDDPDTDDELLREKFCETKSAAMRLQTEAGTELAKHGLAGRRPLWQLIAGGVFDRHPGLKLAITELRSDWLPATLAFLDQRFADERLPVAMKPSEYFHRHCLAVPSSIHRVEIEQRHDIGVAQLAFGVDFPHTEGTWPNTLDWIRASFAGVPEDEARMILGENAIRFYGLDEAKLKEVAERIGPAPEDVLGDHRVDAELIETFHYRAAYSRPVENVNVEALGSVVSDDLASIS